MNRGRWKTVAALVILVIIGFSLVAPAITEVDSDCSYSRNSPIAATNVLLTSAVTSSNTLGTIRYGSAVVIDTQTVNFGTGEIFYSVRSYGKTGYLYGITGPTRPTLLFGNITPISLEPDQKENYTGYQGVDSICEFTNAANHNFRAGRLILLGDRGSQYYQGILLFQQGGLYGGIEPVDIDQNGNLYFNWWYDTSGSSNFSALHTPKRPVILLPGMGASVKWSCLLAEVGCDSLNGWGWMPRLSGESTQKHYQLLINQLAAAGYTEENHYLNVFFYDWRQPAASSALVLKTKIDEVKAKTGATEVDLIGHSMGGLIARAYIQGDNYGDDVAHLITLGSPHKGTAKMYTYWEAGRPYQVGGTRTTPTPVSVLISYYMIRELNLSRVHTLRRMIPSFQDILPTVDYLYDQNGQVKPEAGMVHRNIYLQRLNNDLTTLFARAAVSTFAGQDMETPARFYVHKLPWWRIDKWNWHDGEPSWNRESDFTNNQGDGLVLTTSAILPPPALAREFAVDHINMANNSDVVNNALATLGIPKPVLR